MTDKKRIVDAEIAEDVDPAAIEAEIEEVCPPDYDELLRRAKARLQPPPPRFRGYLLDVSDPEPKWYKPCWPKTLSDNDTRLERMSVRKVAKLVLINEDTIGPGLWVSLFVALCVAVTTAMTFGLSAQSAWVTFAAVAICTFIFWIHVVGVFDIAKTRWENRNSWRTEHLFGHGPIRWPDPPRRHHHHPPATESAMCLEYIVDSLRDIKERRVGPLSRIARAIVRFNESVNTQKTRVGRLQNAIDDGNDDPVLIRLHDTLAERLASDEAELRQAEAQRVEIGAFVDSAKDRLVRPFQTLRIIEECGIDAETEDAANEARAAVVAAIIDTNRDLMNLASQANTLVAGLQAKCLGAAESTDTDMTFRVRLALGDGSPKPIEIEADLSDDADTPTALANSRA